MSGTVPGTTALADTSLFVADEQGRALLAPAPEYTAATAIAHRMPVVTQDADYEDVPGLTTIRI